MNDAAQLLVPLDNSEHLLAVGDVQLGEGKAGKRAQLGETRLGAGPVVFRGPNINPHVFDRLHEAATAREIPVQLRGVPRATGTDANVMQLSRDGVATGLVSIPNRYMHSPVEVVSLEDLERAARLLAEFCLSVTPQMEWIP